MSNLYSLEVVGHGSETQQIGGNLNNYFNRIRANRSHDKLAIFVNIVALLSGPVRIKSMYYSSFDC